MYLIQDFQKPSRTLQEQVDWVHKLYAKQSAADDWYRKEVAAKRRREKSEIYTFKPEINEKSLSIVRGRKLFETKKVRKNRSQTPVRSTKRRKPKVYKFTDNNTPSPRFSPTPAPLISPAHPAPLPAPIASAALLGSGSGVDVQLVVEKSSKVGALCSSALSVSSRLFAESKLKGYKQLLSRLDEEEERRRADYGWKKRQGITTDAASRKTTHVQQNINAAGVYGAGEARVRRKLLGGSQLG